MGDGGVGVGYLSLALDNEGVPHIAYSDLTSYDLKYAMRIDSIWWTQTVNYYGDVGFTPSLALDSAGNPNISFLDYTNYRLMYAKWTGAEWYFDTVDLT